MKQYNDILYRLNDEDHTVTIKTLQLDKQKQMRTTDLLKRGLSDIFIKGHVGNDRSSCSPVLDKNKHYI